MQPIMWRQTASVPYSDTNGVNPTHTQPPMKEDPPKLPLFWSLEQPVTSCLHQLDWFTHVQPSRLPPQPRKPIFHPRSTFLYLLNIYTVPHPMHTLQTLAHWLSTRAVRRVVLSVTDNRGQTEIQAKWLHKHCWTVCVFLPALTGC